jgi:hypothetical protein
VNGVGTSNLLELIAFASSQLASARNRRRKRPLPFQRSEPFDNRRKSHLKKLESTAPMGRPECHRRAPRDHAANNAVHRRW